MKKKEKNKEKLQVKRWGVGKTIAVIISSLAFIVGVAILGIYLGGGLNRQEQILPGNISFNEDADPNFNTANNTLEIADKTFKLTIGSTTQNVTSKKVELAFSYTSYYDSFTQDYVTGNTIITDDNAGTISNGVITIPQTVEIGVPFTVTANTKNYVFANGETLKDWVIGGISTITATAKLDSGVPYTISLKIAVDTPVYKTETVLLDANGNEIVLNNNEVFGVVEEEYFSATTNFYPYESRYVFCNKEEEKSSFYQLEGILDSNIVSNVYESGDSIKFLANSLYEGATVTSFTARDSKTYLTIKNLVESYGFQDFATIYNTYISEYSSVAKENPESISTNYTEFDIVKADIDSFDVERKNQTLTLYDLAGLTIYINKNEEDILSEYLGVLIKSSNGVTLNNALENVVISFSQNGVDPTIGDNSYIKLGNESVTISDTIYYKANFTENQIEKGYGNWKLELTDPTKIGYYVDINVGLLVDDQRLYSDKDGKPILFEIHLKIEELKEEQVYWADGIANSTVDGELVYTDSSSQTPNPAEIDLSGFAIIPEKNYFKTIQYFACFEGKTDDEAKQLAQNLFGDNAMIENANTYDNGSIWSKYLIPIRVVDTLKVKNAGEFQLYFATIQEGKEQNNKLAVVSMVEEPINIKISTPLFAGSVSQAQVLYYNESAETPDFELINDTIYLPTKTDGQTQKIKVEFIVKEDSRIVFGEKFEARDEFGQSLIKLRIYSEKVANDEDKINYDITDFFSYTTDDAVYDVQTGKLSYVLTITPNYTTQEDIEVMVFELEYNNLNWLFDTDNEIYGETGKLYLYTPIANSVVLKYKGEAENIVAEVTRYLNEVGGLDLEIQVVDDATYEEIQTFIDNISLEITDQKGSIETLKQSWTFQSFNSDGSRDEKIIEFNDNGQSFNFAQNANGTAFIKAVCGDKQSENQITFTVAAQGISSIKACKGENSPQLEEIYSSSDTGSSMPTEITIERIGAQGAEFELSNLIKFYVTNKNQEEQEYTKISYSISDVSDLGNMITVQNGLNGESFIEINYNFYVDYPISFTINDSAGAVNGITLNLMIKSNVSSIVVGGEKPIQGLANQNITIESTITYKDGTEGTLTGGQYQDNTYYIVDDGNYILSSSIQEGEKVVGELKDGLIKFYNFFAEESKTFAVIFQPETNEAYAIKYEIVFKISRNMELKNNKAEINVLTTDSAIDLPDLFPVKDNDGNNLDGVKTEFTIPDGDQLITKNGDGYKLSNSIKYDYGKTKLEQIVYLNIVNTENENDSVTFECKLEIVLPDDFYTNLAKSFTYDNDGNTGTASFQIAGTNNEYSYLVFEKGVGYTFGALGYGGVTYSPMLKNDSTSLAAYYDITSESKTIKYKNGTNNLLLGLDNSNVYTYIDIDNNKGTHVYVAVPTIISQIGTTFVNYEGNDKVTPETTLKYALMPVSSIGENNLFYKEIFKEIDAGQSINLTDIIGIKNYTSVEISQANIISDIPNINLPLLNGYSEGKIYINHLAKEYDGSYLGLKITVKAGSGSQDFYYLFKVSSDVTVDGPNYPYKGDAEYLEIPIGRDNIELDETFESDTLQNGKKRFDVLDAGGISVDGLTYNYAIEYVKVNGIEGNLTSSDQWNEHIELNFSGDTLKYNLKKLEKLEFVVVKTYCEGSNVGQLSVVGGEIKYKFVINDTNNYSVEVEGQTYAKDSTYNWTVNDWKTGSDSSEVREENLDFYLIESNINTIYNLMQFNLNDLDGWKITTTKQDTKTEEVATINASNDSLNFSFTYDSSDGAFKVAYPEYLDKDYSFVGIFYTAKGKLIDVIFTFKADARFNEIGKKHAGGRYIVLRDIFTITTSSSTIPVTLTNCEIVESDIKDFIQIKGNQLQLASVLTEVQGYITFKVTWVENGENREYTFTINDFKIIPNLTPNAEQTIDKIIAGEEVKDTLLNGAETDYSKMTYSWDINSTYANVISQESMSATDVDSFNIKTLQVATTTTVSINVTIKAIPNYAVMLENGASPMYTEKVVVVTLIIEPSLKLTVNYPQPNNEETLEVEYIKSGTSFDNFEDDFLNSSAVFTNGPRIGVEYAVKNSDGKVEYNNDFTIVKQDLKISVVRNITYKTNETDNSGNYQIENTKVGDKVIVSLADATGIKVSYNGQDITSDNNIVEFVIAQNENSVVDTFNLYMKNEDGEYQEYTDLLTIEIETILNYNKGYTSDLFIQGDKIKIELDKDFVLTYNNLPKTAILVNDIYEVEFDYENTVNSFVLNYNVIDKRVTVKSISNATIIQNDSSLRVNDQIDIKESVTFNRVSGGSGKITLTVSYNNVVIDYYIEILDEVFALSVNYASNNLASASDDTAYETIYVDKTEAQNLFGENRMMEATLSNNATSGDYYLFLQEKNDQEEDQDEVFISKVLNLSSEFISYNRGKTVYLDLGLTGLSDIENYDVYVWSDANYQFAETNITVTSDTDTDKEILNYLKNNKLSEDKFSSLFAENSVALTSRIRLTYQGRVVDYAYYTLNSEASINDSLGTINTIENFNVTFSNNKVETFINKYSYMLDIDIQVGYTSENNGSVTFEVKSSQDMVTAFNITRKSTNEPIQKDEMISSGATFTLVPANGSNQVGSTGLSYLSLSAITSKSNPNVVYDYRIRGDGASNMGNDVDLILTYKIGSFKKEFNLRAHVVSDYKVYHGSTTSETTYKEDDIYVSNIKNPLIINAEDIKDTNYYNDIVLAGLSDSAYVSVVHENDPSEEYSVSAFNYTLIENEMIDDISYNISNNVSSKLNLSNNNWAQSGSVWSWNKDTNTDLILSDVKIVNFGSQYYKLVAQDAYGYRFYVYFKITAEGTDPSIANSSLSLVEGEEVAFGAKYVSLTVEPGESTPDGKTLLNINASQPQNPQAFAGDEDFGKQVIAIENLQAWGFESTYDEYFTKNDTQLKLQDNYKLANEEQDAKYLTLPNFKDVTIDSIKYYYNGIEVGSKSSYGVGISSDTSLRHVSNIYKSPSNCKLVLPSIDPQYTWIYGNSNSVDLSMVVSLKYTKSAGNTEFFNITVSVRLSKTSQITPKYTEVSDYNTFNIQDYITVNDKGVEIDEYEIYDDTLTFAVDGLKSETFALYKKEDIKTYNKSDIDLSEEFNVGDVIVVDSAPKNATITYNEKQVSGYLKYVEGVNTLKVSGIGEGEKVSLAKGQLVTQSNAGYTYTKLYYISVSQVFNTVLTTGVIKIKDISNAAKFYYSGEEGYGAIEDNTFTISTVQQDAIRVSSYNDFINGVSKEAQYYVIKIGGKAYRYTHSFNVSGTFKSIKTNYLDYNFTLPIAYNVEIPVSIWAENIQYSQVEDGKVNENNQLVNYNGKNLYFVITSDSGTGGTGLASINSETGAITLKDGFTSDHYATVEIYQRVSGVDGLYQKDDVSQMQKLATVLLKLGTDIEVPVVNGGSDFTLNDISVLSGKELYKNSVVRITLPANTSATMVAKSGEIVVNQMRLENSLQEETILQFTISKILGNQILHNVSSLTLDLIDIEGNSEGIDFTITNSQTASGQFNEDINLSCDLSAETTLSVPIGTKSIVVYDGENLLNTITLDAVTEKEESMEYVVQTLLGESGYNGRFITIKYLDEEGLVVKNEEVEVSQTIDLIDSTGKISLTIPANTTFTLNIKDENGDIVNSIAIENLTSGEIVKDITYAELLKVSEENLNILKVSLTLSDIEGNKTGTVLGTITWNEILQENLTINDWGENEEFRYVSKTYYEKADNEDEDATYTLTPVIVYYKVLKPEIQS